jgi:hypothetical protein
MPTPHGTRGALAFSADEVRVLRRALAELSHPSRVAGGLAVPRPAEPGGRCGGGSDYRVLARGVDAAVAESARMRGFLLAEVRRYRNALPGAAAGYLERLAAAADAGCAPDPADLAALRALDTPAARRLRHRCEDLAEIDVRERLEAPMPAPRRLLTLPGPSAAEPDPARPADPKPKPGPEPKPDPDPDPGRRTPTPAEIWPPNRRPAPQPRPEEHAAVLAPRRAS